ncbi:unnamed protein product, partial [Heterosigma akashiwo]
REYCALYHTFGLDTSKRNNLAYIEQDVCLYIAGNALVVMQLSTMKKKYIMGLGGRGVGAFCVHPDKTHVAVGAKENDPKIYIYNYPSFTLAKVLEKGTERGYSCLQFDPQGGASLASVGMAPDYLLTIWDWQ